MKLKKKNNPDDDELEDEREDSVDDWVQDSDFPPVEPQVGYLNPII